MKRVRICSEVHGMAADKTGNPVPAGMEFTLGEVTDEKYTEIVYYEATKGIKAIAWLKALGMEHIAAQHKEEDFKRITPEEYDMKYGDNDQGE